MANKIILFLLSYLIWLLLTWPFDFSTGQINVQAIVAGFIASILVAMIMREISYHRLARLFNPLRYFWFCVYILVFSYYLVKSNLDVAFRVLHPDLPIKPGIVKIKTRLQTDTAITALANSITLTPGTLTVDYRNDGYFYVHWIYVTTFSQEEAAARIIGRFEWFIHKIFEG
ncbi:Na+/H+ antiporter subunit E [candidate division FCPU426 bacterium]|nr:Na+/H+ antiporter subunit E [candidate division FCPU426 bacterium]